MRPSRKRLATVLVIICAAAVYAIWIHTPPGPRSIRGFDPDRVATLELEMWRAYYDKENVRLFRLLVVMLREQYRYTWAKAATVGFYLARPAAQFAAMKNGYETVLPDLERAYTITREWTGEKYDPPAIARAELAWWVARRDPQAKSVENVGTLIAEEYSLFYDVPRARVAEAGRLRAAAGTLRDAGGQDADWTAVSRLLHQSYQELKAGVEPVASR